MKSINEILSAAASLSRTDLGKLRAEIERLDRLANAIVLNTSKMTFRLSRKTDAEHWTCLRRSLAIQEDYSFYIQLHLSSRRVQALNFAQVYLTLKHLAGDSSQYLDDYKMAFSFPFALEVIKGNRTFDYLLDIRNIRDSLYFTLRKMVDPDDKRLEDHRVHPPLEDEFGKEEICYFISYFYGYLLGRWETLNRKQFQPFVRRVPAALIIFGYCNGNAFEEQYNSSEEYDAAWNRLQNQVERESESNDNADVCILLDGATDAE